MGRGCIIMDLGRSDLRPRFGGALALGGLSWLAKCCCTMYRTFQSQRIPFVSMIFYYGRTFSITGPLIIGTSIALTLIK